MTHRAIIDGVERPLVHRPPNTVQCDMPGCRAEIYVERYPHHVRHNYRESQEDAARAEAAAKGWGFVDGQNLCPKHLVESIAP